MARTYRKWASVVVLAAALLGVVGTPGAAVAQPEATRSTGDLRSESGPYFSQVTTSVSPARARPGDLVTMTFTFDERLPIPYGTVDCARCPYLDPQPRSLAENAAQCAAGSFLYRSPPIRQNAFAVELRPESSEDPGTGLQAGDETRSVNQATDACLAEQFPGQIANVIIHVDRQTGTMTASFAAPNLARGTYSIYPPVPPSNAVASFGPYTGTPAILEVLEPLQADGPLGAGTRQAPKVTAVESSDAGGIDTINLVLLAAAGALLIGVAATSALAARVQSGSSPTPSVGGPVATVARVSLWAARLISAVEVVRAASQSSTGGVVIGVSMFAVSFAGIPLRRLVGRAGRDAPPPDAAPDEAKTPVDAGATPTDGSST